MKRRKMFGTMVLLRIAAEYCEEDEEKADNNKHMSKTVHLISQKRREWLMPNLVQ
jgi:hypothetical protein